MRRQPFFLLWLLLIGVALADRPAWMTSATLAEQEERPARLKPEQ